ncbi:MAG: alpha/beta fold hydrolase [Candidatus Omnitrophica bacterium]|nr:alpha/beta fold hydrolase [Candidatus Omnitrophota bacterium]
MAQDRFKALYPFDSHWLDLGGLRYHYVDEGRGEPVVLLHGNPTWSFYYRRLILDLRQRYRVIAPDHIGCGFSDKPQRYAYTLERHIANVQALIERLGLARLSLVMHDWGGPIGMGYAARHPHAVARFVVLNTAAFWMPRFMPLRLRLCLVPVVSEWAIRRFNLFARSALAVACRHQERMTPEVKAGYLAPYDSYANRIATVRFVQDIPRTKSHTSYRALEAVEQGLAQLARHPMLIIWGARDPVFTTAVLRSWQERFPRAIVKSLEDAGHYVMEDASERIIPWVNEFLTKSDSHFSSKDPHEK